MGYMENEDSTSVAWPLYQAQPLRLISPGLLFKIIEELSEKKSSNEEAGLFSPTDNQIATAPHERKCVRKEGSLKSSNLLSLAHRLYSFVFICFLSSWNRRVLDPVLSYNLWPSLYRSFWVDN